MLSDRPVMVDTCTLINLEASGESGLLLPAISPVRFLCDAVSRESLFLRSAKRDEPPQPINLESFVQRGLLTLCQAETAEEEALYVALAAELDDGEALSLAISSVRGYGLATDDRKARRIALEIGSVPLFSTAEILQSVEHVGQQRISAMIQAIEFRGRFAPHPSMPLRDWWIAQRI